MKSPSFSPIQTGLIGVALLVGAALRLLWNNQPFPSSDHAEVAAIITFFYPRNLDMLHFTHTSSWNLLTAAHGMLQTMIALIGSSLIGFTGVHLNEFWWNFPFVLLNLLPIPLSALLVARLSRPGAGVAAAFLVAVLPIHASLSRASGLSHLPLTFLCQLVTVLCFLRYFEEPTPRRARVASIALTINLMVEMLFPVLFVLVAGVGVLAVSVPRSGLALRIHRVRTLMLAPSVMLLPLGMLVFNLALLVAYGQGWISYGGIAARLMEGSDRQSGIYLSAFWNNASFVVGTLAFPLLLLVGCVGLPSLWRREKRAIPLLWAITYLVPFLVFTRPHVYEYFLYGTAPLALNAVLVAEQWWRGQGRGRWLAGAAYTVLLVLFSLRALSMVFGIDVVPAIGTGKAPGSTHPDQGLKAAAWWVRTHTDSSTIVFGDPTFEEYQLWYYLRHPFIGFTDAESPEAAYAQLQTSPRVPTVYLVVPGNELLLETSAQNHPHLVATVLVEQEPAVFIYRTEPQGQGETIDADAANQQFDDTFGDWRTMFAIGERK